MESSREGPNERALVPSGKQDIQTTPDSSLQNTQIESSSIQTSLTNLEGRLDETSLKVNLIGSMVYDLGRDMHKMRLFIVGGLITMVGVSALFLYQIKGIGNTLEGLRGTVYEFNNSVKGFTKNIGESNELLYNSQPITITKSIAEARSDIERINSGYYPHYDLFVLEDIIAGNHNKVPVDLIEKAKQLYQRFAEHRQKVATTETPTQYSAELLGLLNQKVSLEQQIAGAIPTGYYFRTR